MIKEKQRNRLLPTFLLVSLVLLSFIPFIFAADTSIEVLAPSQSYSTSERAIAFQFVYHKGDNGSDFASCNLLLNGTYLGPIDVADAQIGQIRASGFVVGTYRWSIVCNSSLASINRSLYIDPGAKPSIRLVAPLSGYKGDKAVPFRFSYSAGDDAPPNSTCEFWINDTLVRTFDVASGNTYMVEQNDLEPGSYKWYVICGRDTKYETKSLFYEFVIRKSTKPPAVNDTHVILPPVPTPSGSDVPASNQSASPSPQTNVRMAVLSVPDIAYLYDNITLRLLLSDGAYASRASIKVYGPSTHAVITDENGSATFSPTAIGTYTYSVPDFALLKNPKTEVLLERPAGAQTPSFSLPSLADSIPTIVSFVVLILLILAIGGFFYLQRKRAQEEQILHPEHISPTGLVETSPDASIPASSISSSNQTPPSQMPKDKIIEPNPLAPPNIVSIPAENKSPEPVGVQPQLPPTPSMTSPALPPKQAKTSNSLFSPLPPPKGSKAAKK